MAKHGDTGPIPGVNFGDEFDSRPPMTTAPLAGRSLHDVLMQAHNLIANACFGDGADYEWAKNVDDMLLAYLAALASPLPAEAAVAGDMADLIARQIADECWLDTFEKRRLEKRIAASLASLSARPVEVERERDAARTVHRWSVDDSGNGVLHVCRSQHAKEDKCEWEAFVPLTRAEAAEAKLAEAGKALEPFASMGELLEVETEGFSDTDEFELLFDDHLFHHFKVAHFRRARTVHASIREAQG